VCGKLVSCWTVTIPTRKLYNDLRRRYASRQMSAITALRHRGTAHRARELKFMHMMRLYVRQALRCVILRQIDTESALLAEVCQNSLTKRKPRWHSYN